LNQPTPLDRLVAEVSSSPKYAAITPDLVAWIGARELAHRRSLKEAVKATKNKLHQVGGAYQEGGIDYAQALGCLAAATENETPLKDALRQAMAGHASTRERLPILDTFFQVCLAPIAPVRSVLDLACGLNPLAAPWMPLAPGARYTALDIYQDMVDFLNAAFAHLKLDGRAARANLLAEWPVEPASEPVYEPAQVAFLLKTLPCLEQLDKNAGARLLERIPAQHLLISYPARSLGGHDKGMRENYEAHFNALSAGRGWTIQRFAFASELAFLVTR